MKNNIKKYSRLLWVAMIAFALLPLTTEAQNKKDKKEQIKLIVEPQNYVFKAQTALPTGGATRPLTSDYDLRISKDTILSDLPYFGRAFTAPLNPSEGPLRFTSTDFQYAVANRKKGGWDVTSTPKDVTDPRQINMSIFDNGTASVMVNSYNRQPISFNGYITAKK